MHGQNRMLPKVFVCKVLVVLMQSNAVTYVRIAIDLGDLKSGQKIAPGSHRIERFFCEAAKQAGFTRHDF